MIELDSFPSEPTGLSLKDEQGLEVARNLLRISSGVVTPDELGPNYYHAEDGSLGIIVDEDTFRFLAGVTNRPS